jgi:hypothetical protein
MDGGMKGITGVIPSLLRWECPSDVDHGIETEESAVDDNWLVN